MNSQTPSTALTRSCQSSMRPSAEAATRKTTTPSTQAFHAALPGATAAPTGPLALVTAGGAPAAKFKTQGEMKSQMARIRLHQSCQRLLRAKRDGGLFCVVMIDS